MKILSTFIVLLTFFKSISSFAQFEMQKPFGYLFAHMTTHDYGSLYYSLSKDGLNWVEGNSGERIIDSYHGHPDIVQGHGGLFYMIGVEEVSHEVLLWQSKDLIDWQQKIDLPKNIFDGSSTPGYRGNPSWYGAPKMYFDKTSARYIITWHAPDKTIPREDFINYWCSMRTFYVVTSDFKTFSKPKKLFDFEMGTIDVIIRKEGEFYYAILKDECEPSDQWPTGKSIRISVSQQLTGPYSYPGDPVSPNYHEAPTVIPQPNGKGWFMYYEMYTGKRYSGSQAPTLAGPWYSLYQMNYELPENARHGCMIPLTEKQFRNLEERFLSNQKIINNSKE